MIRMLINWRFWHEKRELLHYNKKSLSNFGVHLIDEFHDVQPQAARRKASTKLSHSTMET